ncbi:MAG: sulfatase-like hydrolase/transferase [Luteolibacter sp.]
MAGDASAARNILFIVVDDLGADSSSLTNTAGPTVRLPETPNIDSLATNGVVFTRAYGRPSCSAARAALLTGRTGFRTGVGVALSGTKPELGDNEYTLPRAFAANAPQYALAGFGKWHLGYGANTPWTKGGWPFWAGVNGPQPTSYTNWTKIKNGNSTTSTTYVTTDQVNEASAWITDQENAHKPWLAWVAFNAPHVPYHKPPAELLSPRFASLTGTTADINARQRDYFEALTEAMDKELGRLLTVVDRTNTDIIYIGDNGTDNSVIQPPFKYAPENHAKFTIFEGGVRVPLVITGPDVKYAGRNSTLVDGTDIFQLIQELAGINVAATLPPGVTIDSKSILPALEKNVVIPADLQNEHFNQSTAADASSLRDEKYKLIRFDSKNERFYNLEADPYENTPLAIASLAPDAQAHYYSLKRKFQNYLALPNAATTRDPFPFPFPFPVHRTFSTSGGTATLTYDYAQLRTSSVHTLWRTTDLNDPEAWVPIASRTIAAIPTGTALATVSDSFTDPNAAGGQYFYQVVPSRW